MNKLYFVTLCCIAGCSGTATEDTQEWETFSYTTEPDTYEIGTVQEAVSLASIIPPFMGNNWDTGSYCSSISAPPSMCVVPLTRTYTIGSAFNVSVGPETGSNFITAFDTDMVGLANQYNRYGWSISQGRSTSPSHVAFGSNKPNTLAATTCGNLSACIQMPNRGTQQFCSQNMSTCTTVFDEHQIAQAGLSRGFAKGSQSMQNFVQNVIHHELGHMLGLGHENDGTVMDTPWQDWGSPGVIMQDFALNQHNALMNFRP